MIASHRLPSFLVLACALFLTGPAFAHGGGDAAAGFAGGFLHPLFGFGHLGAMVVAGLWGALLGAPAIWVLPAAFLLAMALGGVLGFLGVAVPLVAPAIAASPVVLGGLVALAARPPLWLSAPAVAVFAAVHGHALGTGLPAEEPLAYAAGFVNAAALLLLAGIALGLPARWRAGRVLARLLGGLIMLIGLVFLLAGA